MERTGQGQDKEVWGMLKQIKVITVYLQRNKERTYLRPQIVQSIKQMIKSRKIRQRWNNVKPKNDNANNQPVKENSSFFVSPQTVL